MQRWMRGKISIEKHTHLIWKKLIQKKVNTGSLKAVKTEFPTIAKTIFSSSITKNKIKRLDSNQIHAITVIFPSQSKIKECKITN